jgi:Polyketide cyclase / dehydrase and lipid transport
MTVVQCTRDFQSTVADAQRLWQDIDRWELFVEGFSAIVRVDENWPASGAVVVWDSIPQGRGRVTEQVLEYQPDVGQLIEIEDDRLTATRRVGFQDIQGGVRVSVTLDYQLKGSTGRRLVLDRLFIKRALHDSLERELESFGRELL